MTSTTTKQPAPIATDVCAECGKHRNDCECLVLVTLPSGECAWLKPEVAR